MPPSGGASRSNGALVKALGPEGEPQLGCQGLGRSVRWQLQHVEARGRCRRSLNPPIVSLDGEALLPSMGLAEPVAGTRAEPVQKKSS
eukprot:scaffold38195_cov64-Phaeocystis_antarctica.AAC.8